MALLEGLRVDALGIQLWPGAGADEGGSLKELLKVSSLPVIVNPQRGPSPQ